MAAALPDADLYALTWNRSAGLSFGGRTVRTTFLDRLPAIRARRALQLPLMPLAWRYASRRTYDVVVTSSHACAKGFWPARRALHLCYCHTPMRYVWLSALDRRRKRTGATAVGERLLRAWDLASAEWVDQFAANSSAVQARIKDLYGRDAVIIHPPVDTEYFTPADGAARSGFALAVSRMVPYKRLDLAIRACHRVGYPLVVAGSGPEDASLRALARDLGARVRFVGTPGDEELRHLYGTASVLVFPGEDDFGIVPVEAQACGTPVVAYGRGGALDTVVPGETGVLVPTQDEASLAEGIDAVLSGDFRAESCRRSAERFSRARFEERFLGWVHAAAGTRRLSPDAPGVPEVA